MGDVGIIGAGLSGLICARRLVSAGVGVHLFDKGRGVGGRVATRRTDVGPFDHGAPYCAAHAPAFREFLQSEETRGHVATRAMTVPASGDTLTYVGLPTMNAWMKCLATDLDITTGAQIAPVRRRDGWWIVETVSGEPLGQFESLIVTAPAPQTAALLAMSASPLAAVAADAEMEPCWTVMVSFAGPGTTLCRSSFINGHPALAAAICDSAKKERPPGHRWCLHSTPDWAAAHLEQSPDQVAHALLRAFFDLCEGTPPDAEFVVAHRWRYASTTHRLEIPLFDTSRRIGVAGDWTAGGGMEGAFLSGESVAAAYLSTLSQWSRPSAL